MTHFPLTRALTALSMPALCFVLACSDHEGDPNAPTEKTESLETPPQGSASPKDGKGFEHRRHGNHFGKHRRGPAGLIDAALEHLELSEEQTSKLTALKTEMRSDPTKDSDPHAILQGVLGEAMKTGKLDRSAADSALANLDRAAQARATNHASALNRLHAILTPEQRTALVAQLEETRSARPPSDRQDKSPARFGRHDKPGRHTGSPGLGLLRGLELTAAQQERLHGVSGEKADPKTMRQAHERQREQHQAMLRAFAADEFDATKFVNDSSFAQQGRQRAEHQVKFVENALSVLTPEQRTEVAGRLTEQRHYGRGMKPAPRSR